jgi:hypothetical protein
MNLRLYDQILRPEIARRLLGFVRRPRRFSGRRRNPKFLEQFLRLIFVDVHQSAAKPSASTKHSKRRAANPFSFSPSLGWIGFLF